MKKIAKIKALLIGGCSVVGLMSGPHAYAQDTGAQVEEITVTAERRSEKMQDVPIAVSAESADQLARLNITSASDLSTAIPSLYMGTIANTITPFLRGVGNAAVGIGNEASTAIYVDDVYYSRLAPSIFDFNNIDRVEVLKGPQGTLFGRNTTGGLIQIVTRDPQQDTSVHASLGYGNYNTTEGSLYATTGFGDHLAGDIALYGIDQASGWGRDTTTGASAYYHDDFAARTKWVYQPSAGTKITVTADYSKSNLNNITQSTSAFAGTVRRDPLNPTAITPNRGFYDVQGVVPNTGYSVGWGGSVRAQQDVSFADLVSISAYRSTTGGQNVDVTGTPYIYFAAFEPYGIKTFTQELQLISHPDSPFDWIVGGFFDRTLSNVDNSRYYGDGIGGTPDSEALFYAAQNMRSISGYGQVTFHAAPRIDVTLGGRYTQDQLSASGLSNFAIPSVGLFVPGTRAGGSKTFEKLTDKVSVDYKVTDDVMAYVSYSRGYKAGIFNLLPFSTTPAKPEVLDSTEVGMKSEWFDHRLRFNIAGFYYKIQNPQVNVYSQGGIQLINAQAAEDKGIDFDGELVITDQLSATFGATILDAHYTSFTNAPCYTPSPYPASGIPPASFVCNANGNSLPDAPRFSGNIGLQYEVPTNYGTWSFNGNYYHTSTVYFQPDNYLKNSPYGLFDAQIGFTSPAQDWAIHLWGKNLTGEKYYVASSEVGGYLGFLGAPGAPRTFGVKLDYNYN
jgi:iron complex outermembrane receptor protein